ncbi:eukaryotic translation initiation factor 2 subunit 2-like [Paramacrobiotus metropolitanus]|uniref:eukaryotic translation initiation factor 2 subunit 2-like n=1 Tax=Paramacrobiotus metropolitanus TaxID=2943436 RepID=UPI002445BA82|nr:eukaryotic translation initiation factor 2 subunit 2-like [Paramacrobiotus metropolitanus]
MADENMNLELTKKKKKKPFNLEKALGDRDGDKKDEEPKEEDPLPDTPGAGDDEELQFTGKKKKKATKKTTEEEAAPTETTVKDDEEALQFGKKKKKAKKPVDVDADEEAKLISYYDSAEALMRMSPWMRTMARISVNSRSRSRGKSVKFADDEEDDVDGEGGADFVDDVDLENIKPQMTPSANIMKGAWLGSDRDYTYDELLTRVFDIMREKNPEYVGGEKRKIVMRPPQVVKVGTKKTSFANFTEICRIMRRQPKHLIAFLLAELGTTGSVDANSQLIIKGRFQQKQIENVLRRYIKEYVTCHTCRSPETLLQKDDQTRVVFLQCETCGSRCSVNKVSAGYQAVTAKRAAMRAKET